MSRIVQRKQGYTISHYQDELPGKLSNREMESQHRGQYSNPQAHGRTGKGGG
ncbi:MAG: hypothetical protein HYU80_00520 [Candidatus Blackburnbacteria bacterium]|nr:hypothetical protein [Candidatus Blackburnbacteria bacterium]